MKIKKIFIYLSLVLSSITLLPSTGRAVKHGELGGLMLDVARATAAQRHTGVLSPRKGYGVDKQQIERVIARSLKDQSIKELQELQNAIVRSREDQDIYRAIALSLEEQEQKQEQDLNQAIALSWEEHEQKQEQDLNQAIALSWEEHEQKQEQDLNQAIALSWEEHERQNASNAQVQTGVVSLRGRNERREERAAEAILSPLPYINNNMVNLYSKEELDFQNLLSEAEVRRISGKPTKTIGRHKIQNIEGFDVLDTALDGLCGLHCLGIDPEKAVSMINHVILTRNLSESQRNFILDTRRHVGKLLSDNKWLGDDHVRIIANLVLQKHIKFHSLGENSLNKERLIYLNENPQWFYDFNNGPSHYDGSKGTIWVHYIQKFHFSKMVER